MALSDNPVAKKRSPKHRSVDAPTSRSWSDKQKLEAVQSYLMLGNLALTSRILSIPEITLRVWKRSDWWATAVAEMKAQENMQMSVRLKKIVDASLGAVEDRLVNGDWIYDQKTGEMRRKPVDIRAAHKVAVDLMDKQEIVEKASTEAAVEKHDEDRLLKLAEKFADMVKMKSSPQVLENVEDVTPKE